MKSTSRGAGPRAVLKNQSYREIAERKMKAEREKIRIKQNDSPNEALESIAQSAQAEANARIVRQSCLNVSSEDDLKKMPGKTSHHAVTYWSHELKSHNPHFQVTELRRGSPLFAKCTSFSNDIKDSRLQHSDA